VKGWAVWLLAGSAVTAGGPGPAGLRDPDDRRDVIDYLERSGSMPGSTLRRTP